MSRAILYLMAILVVTITVVDLSIPREELSSRELSSSRGGDKKSAKCNNDCDIVNNIYVKCTKAGDTCTQCASTDAKGNITSPTADYLGMPGDPKCGKNGGYQEDSSDEQDCGNIWKGTCVVDKDSPTGFSCGASDTKTPCPQEPVIVKQTGTTPP